MPVIRSGEDANRREEERRARIRVMFAPSGEPVEPKSPSPMTTATTEDSETTEPSLMAQPEGAKEAAEPSESEPKTAQPEPIMSSDSEPPPRAPMPGGETKEPKLAILDDHRKGKTKTSRRPPRLDWQMLLQEDDRGNLRGNEFNVGVALRNAPELVDAVALDVRRQALVATRSGVYGPAGQWISPNTAALTAWLQEIGIPTKTGIVDNAIAALSLERHIDPLEDYLNRLKWDGQERIGHWLTTYL